MAEIKQKKFDMTFNIFVCTLSLHFSAMVQTDDPMKPLEEKYLFANGVAQSTFTLLAFCS